MPSDNRLVYFRALNVPRRGHSAAEYEDACAGNAALGRFAIADGATESAFAGLWARLLVDRFVSTDLADPSSWADWLPDLQTRWEAEVGQQQLPWYGEIQCQQGAFATFLGVIVQPPRWQAVAVGDSCLFHVRHQQLSAAFPVSRAADFSDTPWLVGSRGFAPGQMAQREARVEGELMPGDRLWLMTDALAQWFLRLAETRQRPWDLLEPLLNVPDAGDSFGRWIAALRASREIRNDDVTVVGVWCDARSSGSAAPARAP
jgi:hypothetical protein